jgi:Tfp pilus assembly protein PilV
MGVDWVSVLPLIIGVLGLAGLIFTAMRYGRDDTTAVVNQQAQITAEMKTLNDELRITTERLRKERDACLTEVERLRA